tara:strand:- start:7 stop:243 length:237 start_codon:yes stop_codon:yes gene_type:complete
MPKYIKPRKRNPKVKGTGTGNILGQTARLYKAALPGKNMEEQDKIWSEWKRLSPTQTRKRVKNKKALYPGIGRPPRSR